MKWTCTFSVMLCVATAGCQPTSSNSTASAPAAPASPTPISTPATRIGGLEFNQLETLSGGSNPAPAASPAPAAGTAPANTAPASPPAQTPAAAAPSTEQVKAQAGVGLKGKSLEPHSGVVVEPLKQFIRFEQKAVFDIQIPSAMNLFQATEGRKPNSHDEFMSRIITANNIALPRLPAGHRYLYSPEKGELMVEKPAR